MSTLTVHMVQTETVWHNPVANHAHFERLFEALPSAGDLVVLPEMFSTGFTMASREQAEPEGGPTTQWLQRMAQRYGRAFCGSVVVAAEGSYFNRFLLVTEDGRVQHYDKRHRFRMAGEHEHYAAGQRRCIFELQGFRLCPQICYDLRFPVFARNREDYDVLLYVANWPAARALAWNTLLRARAIENLSFVVGVNRVGVDGNDVSYQGDSAAYGPDGVALLALAEQPTVGTCALDLAQLKTFQTAFPAWRDRDGFELCDASGPTGRREADDA